jgi:hypothetical protein
MVKVYRLGHSIQVSMEDTVECMQTYHIRNATVVFLDVDQL